MVQLVSWIASLARGVTGNYMIQNFIKGLNLMLEDKTTTFFFLVLVGILVLGLVGPWVAPHEPDRTLYDEETGEIKDLQPPSAEHPLGTTWAGYDVFSRVLIGARPTVLTGLLGGGIIIAMGMSIGITAGYVGGRTENVLMRFTDFVYGVPLLPFAIVIVTLLGVGFFTSILVIGLVLWRSSARVLRSQVLQIKEYPFITAATASGASTPRIIFKHILPNVMPMAILFFALGVGYSILIQAGLAFLGVVDPFVPSWGVMVRNAFQSGYMSSAWWWSIVPGFLIGMTVLSTFMFGRGYESLAAGESGEDQEIDTAMSG